METEDYLESQMPRIEWMLAASFMHLSWKKSVQMLLII